MRETKQNLCPLLKRINCPLSQEVYDEVVGVLRTQKKEQKVALDEARQDGVERERHRFQPLVESQASEIAKLQENAKHLKEGTTPQSVGFADEGLLVDALRKEFPEDVIEHKGKKGDVLHIVMVDNEQVGKLVYECKRTLSLLKAHIRQAYEAKRIREADEAILVTTGRRKGFGGFDVVDSVYVVAPTGVLALVSTLRQSLIVLKQANKTEGEKAVILSNLRTYATEGKFSQTMSDIVQRANGQRSQLLEEIDVHRHSWQKRWEDCCHIGVDAEMVQEDIKCLLLGGLPKETICLTPPLLQLTLPDEE